MPEQWKGQWYQNGYRHPLQVQDKSLTGKGHCMDMKQDNQRTVRFLFRLETYVFVFEAENAFNIYHNLIVNLSMVCCPVRSIIRAIFEKTLGQIGNLFGVACC